jgi:glycosyltransferase involved in cell wall biosynthesis
VLLKKSEVFETVIPTKMLEFMSCGRPVILGVNGQARQVLEQARGGIYIEPENPLALIEAIQKFQREDFLRSSMCRNGREYIVRNLSRESTAEAYLEVLSQVTGRKDPTEKSVAAA